MPRRGQNFELFNERISRQFGGALLKGNAKKARPLSTGLAIHLVLKSELAQGSRSFLSPKNARKIDVIIRRQAEVFGVRLYHLVNVGNHLHLVLRMPRGPHRVSRESFFAFVRAITGIVARHVLGAEKNRAKKLRFWQARPFTRLVSWGRDFTRLSRYMGKSRNQARARKTCVDWGFTIVDPDQIAELNTG